MTRLRSVLEIVRENGGAVPLGELARRLALPAPVAQEMVDFWVRRGELEATGGSGETVRCTVSCAGCPVAGCPSKGR